MPLSNTDIDIWQARHAAQVKIIDEIIKSFEGYPKPMEKWQIRIKATLLSLQEWSSEQFDFFLEGFEKGSIIDNHNYPAEYALRRTVDQTAYDISVLQRASSQRHPVIGSKSGIQALELADKLAYKALQPAIDAQLLEKTTVITYFQKEPKVRVIPYAPIALIGIPYTCVEVESDKTANFRDFLAIPHEVGHYVFWHGRKKYGANFKHSANLGTLILNGVTPYPSTWYQSWVEEIFADIYSTLVAGPVSVLSLQDMLYDNLNLIDDYGHYPVPIIRPKTHFRVLQVMKEIADEYMLGTLFPKILINKLERRWNNLLKKRGRLNIGLRFVVRSKQPDSQWVSREIATDYLDRTIEEVLNVIKDEMPKIVGQSWSSDTNKIGELYKQFQANILKDAFLPSPPDLIENNQWEANNQHIQWFSHLKAASDNGLTLDPSVWTSLLQAGWLSNGPEDDAGPK